MLKIELDASVCSPQLMDATGNVFAHGNSNGVSPAPSSLSAVAAGSTTAPIGDVLFDFPLSFTIHTELFLYRERFSSTGGERSSSRSPMSPSRGRSPALDQSEVVPSVSEAQLPEATQLANAPTSSPLHSDPIQPSQKVLEDSVLIRFTRTPYEFRHLLDTLTLVFPSLLLPKWPTVVLDRFPGDVLPARQAMAAFLQLTLHTLAALDDVITHDCFLGFIDHSVCPRGKYHQMKIKRPLLDEEHALGRVQLHDRALQPLTANVSKNVIAAATATATTAAASSTRVSEGSAVANRLQQDAAFLRNLMATLQAYQAECLTARLKLQKELSDRQQRRKSAAGGSSAVTGGNSNAGGNSSGLLSSMFSSKLCTLADLSVAVAKSNSGRTLDELPLHAAAHLGDRICSSAAFGSAMTGTVSYLGPKTAGKRADRLVGVSWDDVLPFGSTSSNNEAAPSSPSSPGSTLTGGHWSGAPTTNGKFACRRDQGSMQRWSQVYRDPCEDVTIAAILETCVAVDRCLNPPEVGPFGTALIARNGAWVVGAMIAVCNLEAAATQWCSKILTSYRTFLIAQHWVALQQPQQPHHASSSSSSGQHPFDEKSIQQHTKALGEALSSCMTDFRSAWACYKSARKSNHALVAERYSALIDLFDHVESNRFSGSWLRSRDLGSDDHCDDGASIGNGRSTARRVDFIAPPSRRAGHYGKGTLDGVLMEVDAEFAHLSL